MESLLQEYFSSGYGYGNVNEEVLLKRRISPYATLRPGDLAALLKLDTALSIPNKTGRSHGSIAQHKIDAILEKTQLGTSSSESDDDDDVTTIVCRGSDQGHVPAVYRLTGLRKHEMPVVGVYVDKRICPGFRYCVRRNGSNSYFWEGQVKTLESVGMGYGSRLTFTGDSLNNNDCYFWSDSEPNGLAFSIQAIDAGQKFLIQDKYEKVLGEAVIEKIHEPQEEISMKTDKTGVTKQIRVVFTCNVTYYQRHHHGLKELVTPVNHETISGKAVLHKPRSSRKASLQVIDIDHVYLSNLSNCRLIPDN